MLILCVKVNFQGLCKKNLVNFHYISAIFKNIFSVAVSENNYVSNTVETYKSSRYLPY